MTVKQCISYYNLKAIRISFGSCSQEAVAASAETYALGGIADTEHRDTGLCNEGFGTQ